MTEEHDPQVHGGPKPVRSLNIEERCEHHPWNPFSLEVRQSNKKKQFSCYQCYLDTQHPPKKCRYADKYEAKQAPKCFGPCKECAKKWAQAQHKRAQEEQKQQKASTKKKQPTKKKKTTTKKKSTKKKQ